MSTERLTETAAERVRWARMRRVTGGRHPWRTGTIMFVVAVCAGAVMPFADNALGITWRWPDIDAASIMTVLTIIAGSSWPLAIDRELAFRADPMGLGSTGR